MVRSYTTSNELPDDRRWNWHRCKRCPSQWTAITADGRCCQWPDSTAVHYKRGRKERDARWVKTIRYVWKPELAARRRQTVYDPEELAHDANWTEWDDDLRS